MIIPTYLYNVFWFLVGFLACHVYYRVCLYCFRLKWKKEWAEAKKLFGGLNGPY